MPCLCYTGIGIQERIIRRVPTFNWGAPNTVYKFYKCKFGLFINRNPSDTIHVCTTYRCVYIYIYSHAYIHICVCNIYIYIYVHMHAYIYVCIYGMHAHGPGLKFCFNWAQQLYRKNTHIYIYIYPHIP